MHARDSDFYFSIVQISLLLLVSSTCRPMATSRMTDLFGWRSCTFVDKFPEELRGGKREINLSRCLSACHSHARQGSVSVSGRDSCLRIFSVTPRSRESSDVA